MRRHTVKEWQCRHTADWGFPREGVDTLTHGCLMSKWENGKVGQLLKTRKAGQLLKHPTMMTIIETPNHDNNYWSTQPRWQLLKYPTKMGLIGIIISGRPPLSKPSELLEINWVSHFGIFHILQCQFLNGFIRHILQNFTESWVVGGWVGGGWVLTQEFEFYRVPVCV